MRYPTLIFSLLCMVLTAGAAQAERRVAFVVGNGTYQNVAQLPTPPIDAKALAGVLHHVGFEVIAGDATGALAAAAEEEDATGAGAAPPRNRCSETQEALFFSKSASYRVAISCKSVLSVLASIALTRVSPEEALLSTTGNAS
mgnify:CR=1 FL=1